VAIAVISPDVFTDMAGAYCRAAVDVRKLSARRGAIPGLSVPGAGRLARVEIAVTAIGADGTMLRAIVDTAGRVDADWWEQLVASAHLEVPPPYRPEPGQPVYEVRAGGHVALVAEQDLAGPLRELVMAVVAEGWGGG
jgi:hypothetical protein